MDQKLLDAFHNLPADVKDIAASPKTLDAIIALEDRFRVSLADAIARVFAGLLPNEQFEKYIRDTEGCDEQKAKAIGGVVRSTILKPFLEKRVSTSPLTPSPQTTTPFSVSPEDDKDIAHHRQRLEHIAKESQPTVSQAAIDELIKKHGLQFPSPVLAKRFRTMVESLLRDVRAHDTVMELFTRSEKIGGMGFDQTTAEKILFDVAKMPKVQTPSLPKPAATLPAPIPSVPVVPPTRPPQPKRVAPPPALERVIAPAAPLPPPPPRRPAVLEPGKRLMQDIQSPLPMTPVDELATITLDEFRNLGKDIGQSCMKIMEKISLITEEAYEQRSDAIAAWKRSPVHQLYLALGTESMEKNVGVEEIIERRVNEGLPALRFDEFTAIADLNRRLAP